MTVTFVPRAAEPAQIAALKRAKASLLLAMGDEKETPRSARLLTIDTALLRLEGGPGALAKMLAMAASGITIRDK